MLNFYQNLPLNIDPIAFAVGSFSVRWYAISYLVGFGVVYGLLMWRVKRGEVGSQIFNFQFSIFNEIPNSKQISNYKSQVPNKIRNTKYEIRNTILNFLLVAFFSALIGGRIGYVLFYNPLYFLAHPLAIISPYDFGSGKFVGLYGMSYHGALIGIILGSWLFLRIKNINFWQWADFVVPAAALGYFFGRLGNFLNGELYGRVTTSPWGMYFAGDPQALRYPSQLYEAVLEGLLLFVILWKMRKTKMPAGSLLAIYLIGYGVLRIFAEQFRQPDPQIGFLFSLFTMGQLLSAIMIISGGIILLWSFRKKV